MEFEPRELKETADISSGKTSRKQKIQNLFYVIVILGAIYLLLGLLADLVAENISDETETKWFASWTQSYLFTDNQSSASKIRLQQILQNLKTNAELRNLPYTIRVMQDSQPNALAFPGGTIVVTSALAEEVQSDIGLAMVIAHELGHHQYRHTLKAIGRVLLVAAPLSFLISDSSGFTQLLANAAQASHSQSQEREADLFALVLVDKTYGTTVGALEFFEIAYEKYEKGDATFFNFMSTHPLSSERMRYLQEKMEEMEYRNKNDGRK